MSSPKWRRCARCLTPFQYQRKTRRFCSPKCRVYASRARIEQQGRLR